MGQGKGFTLVEILVSMSIVVLMLGVGIPAFQQFGKQAELDQAASEVQTAILEARNLALSPEAGKAPQIDYYGLIFHSDGSGGQTNQYSVVRIDSNNPPTLPLADDLIVKIRTLPRGLAFQQTPTNLWYSIIGQGEVKFDGDNPVILRIGSDPPRGKELDVNQVTGQVVIRDL
ncbi:prepilin-type N-terminal cleavage/methylation domain-containing protein [Candidatus Berkelbacteria bacterium]|nr:prepilin-type N-terminal cleavage/methylation domain-containing protein [Candidatus Berkelbacteria bacterium]